METRKGNRLAFILLFLLGALASAQSPSYYKSDAFGFQYAQIEEADTPATGYWISIAATDTSTVKVLYDHARKIRVFVSEYNAARELVSESEFVDDAMKVERRYGPGARIQLEREYNADGTVTETSYRYANARLVEKTTVDGAKDIHVAKYLYGQDGRLVEVRESGSGATGSSGALEHQSSGWLKIGDDFIVTQYDAAGRPTKVSRYSKSVLDSVEAYTYADELLTAQVKTYPASDKVIETQRNAEGLVAQETVTLKGKKSETIVYEYDSAKNLVKKTTNKKGIVETVEFSYGEKNEILEEKYYGNGVIATWIKRTSSVDYSVETYDSGILIAIVFYADGRKIKEQYWSGTTLLKERSFP